MDSSSLCLFCGPACGLWWALELEVMYAVLLIGYSTHLSNMNALSQYLLSWPFSWLVMGAGAEQPAPSHTHQREATARERPQLSGLHLSQPGTSSCHQASLAPRAAITRERLNVPGAHPSQPGQLSLQRRNGRSCPAIVLAVALADGCTVCVLCM